MHTSYSLIVYHKSHVFSMVLSYNYTDLFVLENMLIVKWIKSKMQKIGVWKRRTRRNVVRLLQRSLFTFAEMYLDVYNAVLGINGQFVPVSLKDGLYRGKAQTAALGAPFFVHSEVGVCEMLRIFFCKT